jgi:CheY-like chemotaxis protein
MQVLRLKLKWPIDGREIDHIVGAQSKAEIVRRPRQRRLDVCRQLRGKGMNTPIIMLTARG